MITELDFSNYKTFCSGLYQDYCDGDNTVLDAGIIFSLSLYLLENRSDLRDYLAERYPLENDLARRLAVDILSSEDEESLKSDLEMAAILNGENRLFRLSA